MESNINTIANTDIIGIKLKNLLPNLSLNPNELEIEDIRANAADNFFVSAIGVNPDGCHAFVTKEADKPFNHSLGFVGIANSMGIKIEIDDIDIYKSILDNNTDVLAAKCTDIGQSLANMGIAAMQVVNEYFILYLPNKLSGVQADIIRFWVELYENLQQEIYLINCDGKDYAGEDYLGLTASDTLEFINKLTKSRSRSIK